MRCTTTSEARDVDYASMYRGPGFYQLQTDITWYWPEKHPFDDVPRTGADVFYANDVQQFLKFVNASLPTYVGLENRSLH